MPHKRKNSTITNHSLLDKVSMSQSNPSCTPSPVSAQVLYICHTLCLRLFRPNLSAISFILITAMSCLLANTKTAAF